MTEQSERVRLRSQGLYRALGLRLSPARLLSPTSLSVCTQCVYIMSRHPYITILHIHDIKVSYWDRLTITALLPFGAYV